MTDTLVVLLHAYTLKPASMAHVAKNIREAEPNADVRVPPLPFSRIFSCADLDSVVASVLEYVDAACDERNRAGRPYDRIVLVGHSLGALIARKVYIAACGCASQDLKEAADPRPWARLVSRIILLAGMNRGWTISHHLSLKNAILWSAGMMIAKVLPRLTIMQIRRGAPFITLLRMQWLWMRRHASTRGVGGALTVQLLGTIDDYVGPDDNIDLVSGGDFVYLDVPRSGHKNVIDMDATPDGVDRAKMFGFAFTADDETLRAATVRPSDLQLREPREDVTDVVFVIHGIRDEGFWTQRVARCVQTIARQQKCVFETETSSYGYFPMLPFILKAGRRAKVEWLMDQYTEDLALFPNAEFSFIGHSNGTYLLARALELYPAVRFKRVVFAGSVVRTSFDWKGLFANGRIETVLNYIASADWVVAWLPKAWEIMRLQDIGAAGSDGFSDKAVSQMRYIRGGHSAALDERNWNSIAEFVVFGKLPVIPPEIKAEHRSLLVKASSVSPVVWLAGVVLLAVLVALLWGTIATEPLRTLMLLAYLVLLWMIAMRL